MKENELLISNSALAELIETVVSRKKSLRFQAKGFSMFPFVCNNDILTISPFENGHLCLGQVVAFLYQPRQSLAIHRIIGSKVNGYIIKGDNLFTIDGIIPRESILGYVSRVERKGKRIVFGLGQERCLIVFLSRARILSSLFRLGRLLPRPIKRFLNEKLF